MTVISKFKFYWINLAEFFYRSSFQNCISRKLLLKSDVRKPYRVQMNIFKDRSLKLVFL